MSAKLRLAEQQFKQQVEKFQPQPVMPALKDHIILHYNGDPGFRQSYNFTLAMRLLPDKMLEKMQDQILQELARRRPR